MKDLKDTHLDFVTRYFEAGALNTRKAWKKVRGSLSHAGWHYGYVWGLAAALAAVVLGVFIFRSVEPGRSTISAEAAARTVMLPDLTQATLAPGATLQFNRRRFAHKDRALSQSGTVFYDVTRNEGLPFEISTADALVRVLGTSFMVADSPGLTTVDVVSGRVQFGAKADGSRHVVLTQGMHAQLASGASAPEVKEASTPNPAAWATHHFVYNDTPLEEVLKEIGSVFGRRISCDEGGRCLSGEFSADNLEDAVSLIEATLDIKLKLL